MPASGPIFDRYIGIDYSGAETPTSSLKGLRVYLADRITPSIEVPPPPSPRKYWTRRGIGEWLVERLAEPGRTLVGIGHGFSFPLQYFKRYGLPLDWPSFLEDFHRHWPTDENHMRVDFVREGIYGNGAARAGNPRWMRLTERRARTAKSVFRFDVQGSVAKSTHSGLPPFSGTSPLLAVRWLGGSRRILGRGGSLSIIVEPELSIRRPHNRSARRLFRCRMDAKHRSRWPPCRVFPS
jgi:hypothetical protein